ncbi:maltose acetyltransferase domain-containing protein [Streptomyces sp. H39-S7]|uniref:maltose acetyltransferase domain-containing protein n=1 Tax=Streptomyces sp. H39-S7 TaxID=3004357 RepID=UPI0022AEDDDC|nr:maltose acetyltransferase domain-containing protein [Streptomyces sp. H39-S7]MCZ4124552.1 hypothetical protein [Streptomyces sp. H39-S7]
MGENKDRMLAGDWYLPDDADLGADSERRAELCAAYNAGAGSTPAERRRLAVVTKDLPAGVLAVGSPARVIRSLEP